MKWTGALVLSSAVASTVSASTVTPVQKVIQLLEGMMAKGKEEKHAEQVQFAAYKQFCDDTSVEKKRRIEEAGQLIAKLSADIQKAKAHAAKMAKEIEAHEGNVAALEGDKNAATNVRAIEKADYDALHKDYSESVDALGRAISVVKQQLGNKDQAALLQISHLLKTSEQKKIVNNYLEKDAQFLQAPGVAHGYESSSGGVVAMLEGLEDKFVAQRTELEKEETNAVHAFNLLVQDLTAEIAQNKDDIARKSAAKATSLQKKADAEGEKADTEATKAEDEKYLADLTATCEQKASDFESRQQLRADEIVAIEKAIEIMSSDSVTGKADKHLPALLAVKTSLLQMKSDTTSMKVRGHSSTEKAVAYLQNQGKALNSRVLMQLATSAAVGEDVFGKVKKLIQDLITRLMEQANAEAEKKGWCDTELATNEATRNEKTSKVEKLHAEIDQLEASIAKLTEEITSLTEAVAALNAAMAEATKLRGEEKAKNTETIADAKEAQSAVASALTVLKEFYAKAGEATALLQKPEIFDSSYTGMQSENGGVVGMMEVIASDFARLQTDTEAAEAQAQKEYDELTTESKVDKAAKEKSIEHKTVKKQNENQALSDAQADLEGTQKELDAALAYFDKLKPDCIGTVDTEGDYQARVQKRQEEIESLQEALQILQNEA